MAEAAEEEILKHQQRDAQRKTKSTATKSKATPKDPPPADSEDELDQQLASLMQQEKDLIEKKGRKDEKRKAILALQERTAKLRRSLATENFGPLLKTKGGQIQNTAATPRSASPITTKAEIEIMDSPLPLKVEKETKPKPEPPSEEL